MADSAVPGLARVRGPSRGPAGDALPPPRRRDRLRTVVVPCWTLAVLVSVAALVALRLGRLEPTADLGVALGPALAAALTTLLSLALAWRVGGRPVVTAALTAVVTTAAVASAWPPLLAGAALTAAVVGGALAVVLTVPAAGPVAVARELLLALAVGIAAALAVEGYAAPLADGRFDYAALALALVVTVGVVHPLGGGVHGLGRVGGVLVVGGVAAIVLSLAYAWALNRWGAPDLVADAAALHDLLDRRLGAVPHPIQVLVGVPALVVGVAVRDRRRQGWWVCAFGATAVVPITTGLAGPDDRAIELLLATAYAAAAGLVLGLLVLGVLRLTGGRLRRPGHRPEPSRTRALR